MNENREGEALAEPHVVFCTTAQPGTSPSREISINFADRYDIETVTVFSSV